MKPLISLLLLSSLLLTGCSSREAADRKIAKACEVGVRIVLKNDKYENQIDSIKDTSFADYALGRKVSLKAAVKNKAYGYEGEESYDCIFDESYLPGFINWNASLTQIVVGSDVYGKDASGKIQGSLQDFMNITDSVAAALEE